MASGAGERTHGEWGKGLQGERGSSTDYAAEVGMAYPGRNAPALINLAALPCLPFVKVVLGMAKVASPEDLNRQKGAGALGEARGGEGRGGHEL